jgi:hypothetical protein
VDVSRLSLLLIRGLTRLHDCTNTCGERSESGLVSPEVAAHAAGKRCLYEAEQQDCHLVKGGCNSALGCIVNATSTVNDWVHSKYIWCPVYTMFSVRSCTSRLRFCTASPFPSTSAMRTRMRYPENTLKGLMFLAFLTLITRDAGRNVS